MFVALELRSTLFPFAKKKRLFQVDVPGGTSFCIIDCPIGKKVPWNKVARLAGEQGRYLLLLPPGITPPVQESLAALELSGFYDALNLSTLRRFLPLLRPFRKNLRLGVIDSEGRLAPESANLLRCARKVCVFTDAPERYEDYREESMAQTGAALLVSPETEALLECRLVLAPFGTVPNLSLSPGTFLYGCASAGDARILNPSGFALPEELETLRPQGIEPIDFAGALYEKCGLRALASRGYEGFQVENQKISLAEGARWAADLDRGGRIYYNKNIVSGDVKEVSP